MVVVEQVVVVELVGDGDHLLVPLVPAPALVATEEQDGAPPRVERKQDAEVAAPRP